MPQRIVPQPATIHHHIPTPDQPRGDARIEVRRQMAEAEVTRDHGPLPKAAVEQFGDLLGSEDGGLRGVVKAIHRKVVDDLVVIVRGPAERPIIPLARGLEQATPFGEHRTLLRVGIEIQVIAATGAARLHIVVKFPPVFAQVPANAIGQVGLAAAGRPDEGKPARRLPGRDLAEEGMRRPPHFP